MIEEFNNNGGKFVRISYGKLNYKCEATDDKAIAYEWEDNDKNKQTSYKREFPALSGKVTKMAHVRSEYGTNLCVTLSDGMENFIVQFKYESAEYERFIRTAASITDWDQPLRIGVSEDKKFGSAIWLSQGETKFKWKWGGKADSDEAGIPAWKEKVSGGFDKTDMYEWFYNYVENNIIPKISGEAPEPPQVLSKEEALPLDGESVAKTTAKAKPAATPSEDKTDDLPF